MENIKVGDILIDRDTRRVGRKLKVIWVDDDSVTAEVVSDSLNAKKSSVGNSTDISRSRLKKGYTLAEFSNINSLVNGKLTIDSVGPVDYEKTLFKTVPSEKIQINSGQDWNEEHGFIEVDGGIDSDLVNDPNDLEDALNSAGYFWLPPVSDLADAVLEESGNLSKSGLVHLIHATIKQGLVSSN